MPAQSEGLIPMCAHPQKRSTFGRSRWSPRGTVVWSGTFSLFVRLLRSLEVGIIPRHRCILQEDFP
jgi:hypothetical protein